MKQMNYKKLIIPNIPYVFFVYLFDKVGQAVRLAPGADISEKILNITQGFSEAFSNALPSVHPLDLLREQGRGCRFPAPRPCSFFVLAWTIRKPFLRV